MSRKAVGTPSLEVFKGQAAWSSEQPGLGESVPAVAEELKLDDLLRFLSTQTILIQ